MDYYNSIYKQSITVERRYKMLNDGEFAIIYNRKSGKFERVESTEKGVWEDRGFVNEKNLEELAIGINLHNIQDLPCTCTRFIDDPNSSIICIIHMGRLI